MDNESPLIRAMAGRDKTAWAKVYDRHVGDVFGLVYHLVGRDAAIAEDVTQEVWLLAIESFDRFDRGRGTIRDWLLGIARHQALRRYCAASAGNRSELPDRPANILSAPELLEQVERADMVRAGLLCLNDDRRQVLLDKYVAGASVKEIAQRSNQSVKAVESLLSRARASFANCCDLISRPRPEANAMNHAMPGLSDDGDEELLARLVSEAGDPSVTPRPEYVAGLRDLLIDRLGAPQRAGRLGTKLLVGSGLAALALGAVTLALLIPRPAIAWTQVAQALKGLPWVHTRTLGPDGKEYGQAWFSTRNGVVAFRHGPNIEYHDRALQTFTKYVRAEKVLYRLPESSDRMPDQLDFVSKLLDGNGPTKSPVPGMEVVAQSRRDVVEGESEWIDIDLTLRVVGGDRQEQVRFRIDPATKRPHSVVFQSREGQGTTLFDYPDHGPADIYELGVPRTAKLVDRTPGEDLNRVLAGLKAGRLRFDDYQAIMDMGDGMNIKRVWRKGRKWRVESLQPISEKWPLFPKDADAQWWKKHQLDYPPQVQAICDGEKVYYYRSEQDPGAAEDQTRLKLTMTQAINPSDDPFMPWPDMFPEHVGHPNIWQPSNDREFLLDPKPADGPPATLRVNVHDTRSSMPGRPDLYKLWLSPEQSYIAVRSETSVFNPGNPPKLAYVDTRILEGLARRRAARGTQPGCDGRLRTPTPSRY